MTFNPSRRQVFARSFSTRESTLVSQATFFGPKAPAEVTSIVPFLTQLEKPLFQRILQFVIEYMRGTEVSKQFRNYLLFFLSDLSHSINIIVLLSFLTVCLFSFQ
jgi:hypothetical protein